MFYGWLIVGVAFVTHCINTGIVFYSFGVFLGTLTEHFGWSRAQVSFGFSLVTLCGAAYSPFVGRAVDRLGPRPSQLAGAVVMALGFLLLRRIETITQFYLLMGLAVSLGSTALGNLPSNTAVARWFVYNRGRALGISTAGISMGGVIFVPLTQWLITRYGWRDAFSRARRIDRRRHGAAGRALHAPLARVDGSASRWRTRRRHPTRRSTWRTRSSARGRRRRRCSTATSGSSPPPSRSR